MSETNGYATKQRLFEHRTGKRRFADVEVDGEKFRVRSLNDLEMSKLNVANMDDSGGFDVSKVSGNNARWIIACVVDQDGNQLFTEADLPNIRELDGGFVVELAELCREHNARPGKNLQTESGVSRIA